MDEGSAEGGNLFCENEPSVSTGDFRRRGNGVFFAGFLFAILGANAAYAAVSAPSADSDYAAYSKRQSVKAYAAPGRQMAGDAFKAELVGVLAPDLLALSIGDRVYTVKVMGLGVGPDCPVRDVSGGVGDQTVAPALPQERVKDRVADLLKGPLQVSLVGFKKEGRPMVVVRPPSGADYARLAVKDGLACRVEHPLVQGDGR